MIEKAAPMKAISEKSCSCADRAERLPPSAPSSPSESVAARILRTARRPRARLPWPALTLALALAGGGDANGTREGAGSVVLELSWTPPTTKGDGSPMTDVVGYRIYFGTARGTCPGGRSFFVDAERPAAPGDQPMRLALKGLKIGERYYAAVTAVSTTGGESACSAETSARVRQPD